MTCEINNTINIEFKDGSSKKLECSYLSFDNAAGGFLRNSSILQVHGRHNIIFSVCCSDIDNFTMTDNPCILIDGE